MSGIAGIYFRDNRPLERQDLMRMIDALMHRGPDGTRVWLEASVGLCHCRLWAPPEASQESLPLLWRNGELAITVDGRIDNRSELMQRLEIDRHSVGQLAEGELILAAYEKWGERCPEYLLGDFAFAIWDRQRQQLFCARDHFGVKPFYYYLSEDIFAFASEIKALFHLPAIPRQLNELKIAGHLVPLNIDPAATLYEDILRLLPAHSVTVGGDQFEKNRYWQLDPSHELNLGSDEAYAEAFRELFTAAISCRMSGTLSVGSMLSGGLDSSSIACVAGQLMAEAGGGPLPTFSAVFDNVEESDEREYIEAVLRSGLMKSHYFHADKYGPLADLNLMMWHQDGLFGSGNLYLMWGIYRLAEHHGVRVILDGFDGDRVVPLGHCHIWALTDNRRWLTLARELRALQNVQGGPAWPTMLWNYMKREYPQIRAMRRYSRRLRRRFGGKTAGAFTTGNPTQWSHIIAQAFAQHIELPQRQLIVPSFSSGRDAHRWILTGAVIGETFEELDKAGSAFGLEIRYPFFDRRLVEFCFALPKEQQLNSGWTRMILRRAMENILPKEVQWRPDKGDVVPGFDFGLVARSRSLIEESIQSKNSELAAYVDVNVLQQTYRRLKFGNARAEDGATVWKAITLASWLRYWDLNRGIPAR